MGTWSTYDEIEYKRLKTLYFLCFFLGWAGVHRFYQKKIGTGILYLCTFGLFAVGWLVDGIKLALEWQKLIDKKKGRTKKEVLQQVKHTSQMALYQNTMQRCCPGCGGTRFHAFVEDEVLIPAKVKSRTTLNLNPLKPFTVFNHKEKVVRKGWTRQVSKFVCDDCGKIFQ